MPATEAPRIPWHSRWMNRLLPGPFAGEMTVRAHSQEGRADRIVAILGTIFLIAVAIYLPFKAYDGIVERGERHAKLFEACLTTTGNFRACYISLGYCASPFCRP